MPARAARSAVDRLDVAILRETMRDRVVVIGSNDPRLSAEAIARRIKVDPTTVRDRLRAWRKTGFLQGFTVLPNLSLFGAGLAFGAVRVPDPRAKAAFVAAMPKVDGVVGMMEHVGEWVGLAYADESAQSIDALLRGLAAMPGVAEVTPAMGLATPSCDVELTPLDWRIVDALRRHPQETLAIAAKETGVSTRTFTRRYERLVGGRALWCFGLFDFGRCVGRIPLHLTVTLEAEADAEGLVSSITKAAADSWYAWHVIPPTRSGLPVTVVDFHLLVESVGEIEELQRVARDRSGIVDVESYHTLRLTMFDAWVAPRIAEAAKRAGP